jgi:hypothetical protein
MTDAELREMDALVASKLFSKVVDWKGGATPTCWDQERLMMAPVTEYTAGWDGVGLVVEEMIQRGWMVLISSMSAGWDVRIYRAMSLKHFQIINPDIGPAVALAALAALEATK